MQNMQKIRKQTNEELFIQEVDKHWAELKSNDETIFENIEIHLNSRNKYQELKENFPELYGELLHENSIYDKKRMISEYFWDRIVGDLYENTLRIMEQANILEEANRSFENGYKIETTAKLILENGIFAKFSDQKKKELTNLIIEAVFYPNKYQENHGNPLDYLEEGKWMDRGSNTLTNIGSVVTGAARAVRSTQLLLTTFLISPASLLIGNFGNRAVDEVKKSALGKEPAKRGINPSMRKLYSLMEEFWPVKIVYNFLNKDQLQLYNFVKKSNNLDNEYIQDILKTAGGNSTKMVHKCWEQHKIQPAGSSRETVDKWEKFKHFMSGKGLANMMRDPQYADDTQIGVVLSHDASDPKYQKRFYDYRICVYEKLFEIILGYAKAIYSMDDASYEIIKSANEAHQKKNFKAFFDLRPKDDNEEAMFQIMKALVAVDDISQTLKQRKGDLVADPYIDRFSQFLDQNIKSIYDELDEMANQRRYNLDRYQEEQPDDEEKAAAIREDRFNQKKSIFED